MDEPVRLVCPHCQLVYRLKRWTPGKNYHCKSCGNLLDAPLGGGGDPAQSRSDAVQAEALERLAGMLDDLGGRVEEMRNLRGNGEDSARDSELLETAGRLETSLRESEEEFGRRLAEIEAGLRDLVPGEEALRLGEELRAGLGELDRKLESGLERLVPGEETRRLHGDLKAGLGELEERFSAGLERFAPGEETRRFHEELKSGLEDFGRRLESGLGNLAPGEETRRLHGELKTGLAELETRLDAAFAGALKELAEEMRGRLSRLEERLSALMDRDGHAEALDGLRREMREGGGELLARFLERLERHRENQKAEFGTLLEAVDKASRTVEVDVDALAGRMLDGVRVQSPLFDNDSGTIVDAVAKFADELTKRQQANTAQMEKLAVEIRNAVAGVSMLEEWRSGLPERVADEIGQNVEDRVVAPISNALARQAPAILSELQDSKLVDIVSRSVREAQRPLLREILAGGRGGVSGVVLLAVLVPLLLILGYLSLSGDVAVADIAASQRGLHDRLARIEEAGAPMTVDMEERVLEMHAAVADMRSKALEHAENSGRLVEQVDALQAQLKEKDQLISQYEEMVKTQTRKMRQYEMKLAQLGVSPASVTE